MVLELRATLLGVPLGLRQGTELDIALNKETWLKTWNGTVLGNEIGQALGMEPDVPL